MPNPYQKPNISSVSIIIPTKNHAHVLKQCIDSLLYLVDNPSLDVEFIIINNQSSEESALQYLKEIERLSFVRVLSYDSKFNFSAINNLAVEHAKHNIICFLNNDIEVISHNWLNEMLYFINRENIGCIGAKLYYPDNTIQHAGVVLGINGVAGHIYKHEPRDASGYDNHLLKARYYSAVTAACMLVKKSVYLEVGGFDEGLAVAYNDIDFCLKLGQLGYKHIWTPRAELYHHESISRGSHKKRTRSQQRQFKREVKYMKKKWGSSLSNDPSWHTDWPLSESWNGQL